MLLAVPDCFTSFCHNKPTTTTFLFQRGRRPSNSVNPTRTRRLELCKATLITNSDSFEVGRFVGSYGFMNITRSLSPLKPFQFSPYFLCLVSEKFFLKKYNFSQRPELVSFKTKIIFIIIIIIIMIFLNIDIICCCCCYFWVWYKNFESLKLCVLSLLAERLQEMKKCYAFCVM